MFGLTDKIIGALALVMALALAWQTYRLHGAEMSALRASNDLANGQAAWADERAIASEKLVQATAKNRETEQQLTAQAEKAEHEKQTQIAAVSARADDLRKRLRNAEASAATARLVSKASAVASTSEVAGVDHFPVIFGPLGEQLVSEAERGEKIRISLLACYRQYDDARKAMVSIKP